MNYLDNYCAITEVKPGHFHQTRVAATTFIKNNPWFDGILVILTTNLDQITVEERAQLDQIYDKIDIVEIDRSKLKDLEAKIKTSKRDFNSIFDYFFTYAFGIKSKGNLYFKSSVIFNKSAVPFLEKDKTSFVNGEGRIPMGSGNSLNPAMFYIPGELTSDSLQESVIKYLRLSNNIYHKSAPSFAIQAALEDHRIPINKLPMINLVDSSNFPNTKYREFLRYNKGIVAINMNTIWVNDNRFTKINLYWQHANQLSLKYQPSNTKISKKKATDAQIKRHQRYVESINSDKIYPESGLINKSILKKSKIAVCTICNDDFIKGAQVMIHSFLNKNKWFNGDVIVMYSDELSPLSKDSRRSLVKIYPNIKFKRIDESIYSKAINKFVNKSGLHLKFMPSLFTFETFSIEGYDLVAYIDSDILHINSMEEMFRTPGDLVVTPAATDYPRKYHHSFSGGVFLVRDKMISSTIRDQLIKFSIKTNRFNLLDQTIMNDFFKNTEKSWVSNDFNCSKRCFSDSNFSGFRNNKIALIHYVSDKPWNSSGLKHNNYKRLEKLWHNYYESIVKSVLSCAEDSSRVLVIGNSPLVNKHRIGLEIDNFDIIVRVNDFRTIGFEDKVGTKTNHVITSFATNFKTREYDKIYPHQIQMSLFDKRDQVDFLNNRIERYKLNEINILSDYYYIGLNNEIGISGKNKRCSSGTIAIKWAMDNYPSSEIYIHGIDLTKSEAHYFSQTESEVKSWKKSIEVYHDFNKEIKWIDSLIKGSKIKKLI